MRCNLGFHAVRGARHISRAPVTSRRSCGAAHGLQRLVSRGAAHPVASSRCRPGAVRGKSALFVSRQQRRHAPYAVIPAKPGIHAYRCSGVATVGTSPMQAGKVPGRGWISGFARDDEAAVAALLPAGCDRREVFPGSSAHAGSQARRSSGAASFRWRYTQDAGLDGLQAMLLQEQRRSCPPLRHRVLPTVRASALFRPLPESQAPSRRLHERPWRGNQVSSGLRQPLSLPGLCGLGSAAQRLETWFPPPHVA
jgi:hypothetical protein